MTVQSCSCQQGANKNIPTKRFKEGLSCQKWPKLKQNCPEFPTLSAFLTQAQICLNVSTHGIHSFYQQTVALVSHFHSFINAKTEKKNRLSKQDPEKCFFPSSAKTVTLYAAGVIGTRAATLCCFRFGLCSPSYALISLIRLECFFYCRVVVLHLDSK